MSRFKKSFRGDDCQQIGPSGLEITRMYTRYTGDECESLEVELFSRGEREKLEPVLYDSPDFEYDDDILIT